MVEDFTIWSVGLTANDLNKDGPAHALPTRLRHDSDRSLFIRQVIRRLRAFSSLASLIISSISLHRVETTVLVLVGRFFQLRTLSPCMAFFRPRALSSWATAQSSSDLDFFRHGAYLFEIFIR